MAPEANSGGLSALSDLLLRAQVVTGIAPNMPEVSVYAENYEPRRIEARRRLRELGYPRGLPDYELFGLFRSEAGLPRTTPPGRLDRAAWDALDELRGLESEVDGRRWRDRGGRLLPAMRRAIRVRGEELGVDDGGPLAFGIDADEGGARPPTAEETADGLRSLSGALGRAGGAYSEEELLSLLFSQERMVARSEEVAAEAAEDPLSFADVEDERVLLRGRVRESERARLGLPDDDPRGADAETDVDGGAEGVEDEPLAFGGGRPRLRIREFFRDLVETPELRRRPSDRQLRMHLIKVTPLLDRISGIEERWRDFRGDSRAVWEGKRRAGAWLHGASKWFKERGLGLAEGLENLLQGAARAVEQLAGYVKAMFTNLFRVLYHDLARVFEATHGAAAAFVDYVRGPTCRRDGSLQVAVRRRADGVRCWVAQGATGEALRSAARSLRERDQRLLLSAELLGLVLGAVASWTLGGLSALHVLRDLGRRAQRILHLGRRLEALGAPTRAP